MSKAYSHRFSKKSANYFDRNLFILTVSSRRPACWPSKFKAPAAMRPAGWPSFEKKTSKNSVRAMSEYKIFIFSRSIWQLLPVIFPNLPMKNN